MKDFTLLRSTRYCCRVCWHWVVTSGKKIKAKPGLLVLSLLLYLMAAGPARAQVDIPLTDEIKANFGVEADVYANVNEIIDNALYDGTDDWFQDLDQWPGSGEGVIDVSSAAALSLISQWEVDEDDNIGGELRQSIPIYTTTLDGRIWIDAVYGRDQRTNGKLSDMSFFTAGDDKNFQDPETWTIGTGSGGPQKNDIIEFVGHLRRDNDGTINTLGTEYAIFGATTRSQNGTSHLDFELFRAPVELIGGNLVSEGTECNRTAYEFAADGSVITHGDVIFSVNYENGGDNVKVELYIWIDRTDFPNVTAFQAFNALPSNPFDFGSASGDFNFYECNTDPNYGYAQVSLVSALSEDWVTAQINQAPVTGPPWGTYNSKGDLVDDFPTLAFIEISLDATALGLDTGTTSGSCQNPLGSVIVKTRSSASFTAELKDLSGPYQLGDTPEVDVTLADQALNCTLEFVTLQADVLQEGTYKYEWFIKDGEDFVKLEGIPEDQDELQVSEPGIYKVRVTRIFGDGSEGCFDEDEATVTGTNDAPELVTTCPEADTVSCTEDINSAFTTWLNTFDVTGGGGTVTSTYTVIIDGGAESAPIDFANWPQGITEPDDVCGGGSVQVNLSASDECTQSDSCSSTFTLNPITPGLDLPQNGSETVACASDATDPGAPATIQDACGNDVVPVMIGSVSNPDPITCEGTVVWTYRYTECNESTSDWSYVYTIEYEGFEIADADGSETVECEADADGVGITLPTVFDNCDNELTPTGPVVTDEPDPITCEGTRTYTWTYTDCEQNSDTWSYVYTIEYEGFEIADADGSETVECEADADGVGITLPTVFDNCDNELTPTGPVVTDEPDPITCEGTRTYTWTYTDCEQNSDTWSYVYTIEYEGFEIADADGSETVECEADADGVGITLPTVFDNCDNELTPTGPVVTDEPDPITCEGTRTYTWTYTDCEQNSDTWSYVYTIEYEGFEIADADGSETVECEADADGVGITLPTVFDNCDNELTPTGPVVTDEPDPITCEGTRTYTWTYTDCEQNSDTWSYVYTIEYEGFEIADADGSETVECEADADGVGITLPTVFDNCDNELTPTGPVVTDEPDPITCEGTRTYTWTYTDCEQNSDTWSYVYTIEYEGFEIADADGSETVECEADADGVGITLPTVFDNCDNELTPTGPVVTDEPDPITCEGTRTYTWTYTDCEQNSDTWSYVYTIEYEGFEIADADGSETVECEADADGVGITLPTVFDNCDNELTPTGPVVTDEPDPITCEGTRTYTWTYTDCEQNSDTWSYVYTIEYEGFEIADADGSETVECEADADGVGITLPTVFDNCDNELTPTGPVVTDEPDPITCEGTRTYTWTYTDCEQNSDTWSYVYTIEYEGFEIADADGSETVECEADADGVGITLPTVFDNCDNELTPTGPVVTDEPDPITCEGTRTYTWTYTDCEQNSDTWSYVYTIEYEGFEIADADGSETVECEADADGVGITLPTVFDNCDNELTPTGPVVTDEPDPITCEGTRTYTWTYTDCEQNSDTWSYVYTIEYEGFEIADADGSETVECEADADGVGITLPTVFDNCDNELTPTGPVVTDEPDPITCEGTRTYTWTYTDCEQNSDTWSYVYTIEYEGFEIADADGSETVECEADADGVGITLPTVFDNCDNELTPTGPVVTDEPDPITCEGTRTYTWTYTDCEQNSDTWSYVYTIEYEGFEIADADGSETVECEADADGVGITLPTVFDNCDNELTPTGPVVTDEPDPITCEGTRTYTWTYTDCEQNSDTWSYVYTIEYEGFEIADADGSETVECEADADGVGITLPTVFDNCDNELTPTGPVVTDEPDPITCEGTRTYTWTYTDCEQNSDTWSYVYTIEYEGFEIADADGSETVECEADADGVGITLPTVFDNCDNELTPTGPVVTDEPDPITCEGTRTYTWTYTDCEQNSDTWSYVYTIDYTQGVEAPADDELEVQCPEDVVMPDAPGNITDACGRIVEPVFTGRQGNPEEITCKGTVIYTWTYTACDGETTDTYTYTYNIEDTIDPVIEVPEVGNVCEDEVPESLSASWTDNCADGEENILAFPVLVGEDECSNTYRYTWTVNDGCGNTDTASVEIVQEFDVVGECETIFGYTNDDISQCFLEDDFNRWGWTNNLTSEDEYVLTLYAGAGQCDRNKGAEAGTAIINYENDEVTVTYQMNGYTLTEAHVYIGCTPYPIKNGRETVAPGQYNFNPSFSGSVQSYQVGPIDVSDLDDVYVIVHGVACEIVCQCTPDPNGEIPSAFDGASATCDESQTASNGNGNGNGKNNKTAESSFSASPVPFNDKLTLKYDFEYTSNKVDIQVYDLSGRLLRTYSDKKVKGGDTKELNIDFALKANQVYIIRMVTDREVLTKNVISSSRK